MKTIKQTYLINASRDKVWQALVDPKIIDGWGGGPAKMSEGVGFKFSLWGGDIHGKNIKVLKEKQLVQEWISGDWEQPSKVTFNLSEESNKTKIELIHEGIPDDSAKDIKDGWIKYYLGPLKELLEN